MEGNVLKTIKWTRDFESVVSTISPLRHCWFSAAFRAFLPDYAASFGTIWTGTLHKTLHTETRTSRTRRILSWAFGCFLLATLIDHATAAEYYENEPRASSYRFQVWGCNQSVIDSAKRAAEKFGYFLPVTVVEGAISAVGYNDIDTITCTAFASPTSAKALRKPCWNDQGLLRCVSEVYSQTSGAVIGRATWWRRDVRSRDLLECDIELDPNADDMDLVVAHEYGHCAGLNHQWGYAEGLMYPDLYVQTGFHFDDLIGLCHLYGCEDDIVDDYGNILIQRAIRQDVPGIWTGVLAGGRVIFAEEVVQP